MQSVYDIQIFLDIHNTNHSPYRVDLLSVAIHEIGHILGLAHSTIEGSVMWPLLQNGVHTLHQDDINGVQNIYGTKSAANPPPSGNNGNFKTKLFALLIIFILPYV